MKTVFFFCLCSLGVVLVLTQARQPFLTDVGCKLTMSGYEYTGSLSVTRSGRTCQRWDLDRPHRNRYKDSKLYPDGSLAAAGNKCRNPDKDNGGVWCLTIDPDTRWEYCNVDLCDVDCKVTRAGREYNGHLNVTRSGRTCQRWNSDDPHENYFKQSKLFPERSAWLAGNKCRNPDDDHEEEVWCYTTDPNIRWENCNVDFCECKLTKAGREYAGSLSVTRSGRRCQRWSSDQPHSNRFKGSTLFPEGSALAAGNKCRNPNKDYNEGVWCYTTDPNTRWEECDVDYCLQTRSVPPSTTKNPKTTTPSTTSTKTTPPSTTKNPKTTPPYTANPKTTPPFTTNPKTTSPSTTNPKTTSPSTANPKTTPASTTNPKTTPASTTNPKTTPASTKNPKTTPPSTKNPKTTSPSTTKNPKTTPPSTTKNPKTTPPSTENPKTTPASTKNLMTSLPRTTPDTTSPPSTTGENASTNIAGVIAVVCVIVVGIIIVIIIWKRVGSFQSPCRSLDDEGNPPRSRRNQQKNMAAKAMYKPSENPDDVNCQLQSEMPL